MAEGGDQPENYDDKPVKSKFDPSGYDKDLVENLERDIVQTNPNVHWYVIGKSLLAPNSCCYVFVIVIICSESNKVDRPLANQLTTLQARELHPTPWSCINN